MIGDIKKMYHTVKVKTIEQHTHRYLWRDTDTKTTSHVCHTKSVVLRQAIEDDRYCCIEKNSRNGSG